MLRDLSNADKQGLADLLAAIQDTFSLYWRHYPPYKTLQDRGSTLDSILNDNSTDNHSGELTLRCTGILYFSSRHNSAMPQVFNTYIFNFIRRKRQQESKKKQQQQQTDGQAGNYDG